jgi:hypothetical protein
MNGPSYRARATFGGLRNRTPVVSWRYEVSAFSALCCANVLKDSDRNAWRTLGPRPARLPGYRDSSRVLVDVNMGTTLTISHVAGIRSKILLPVWSSRTYRGKNSKHGWITSTLQEASSVNRRDNGPLMNSKIQWFEDSMPPSKWNEICYQWRCLSWKKLGGSSISPGSMRRDCILWMWLGHVVSLG